MLRRLAVAALLSLPVGVGAQVTERSAVADLLARITADINDLRYAEAITRGRLLAERAGGLPVAQRTQLHLLMAAAFFPEDRALQSPDSAAAHLVAALRLAPDAAYPADLRWRGLDSLHAAARSRTPAIVLRAPDRQAIGGPDGAARVGFVATRVVVAELRVVSRATGEVIRADTTTGERGDFAITLHDGSRVQLPPGEYDLMLSARSDAGGDVQAQVHRAVIEAAPPQLEAEPSLVASALLPERATPDRGRIVRTGLIAAAATIGLGVLGHSHPDLRGPFGPDPRAFAVGGTIALGSLWFAKRGGDRPLPANVAANRETRAAHDRAVAAVRERNATRLRSFTGVLLVSPDVP